ncbi:MAG: class 1 fructose-bisphosphatase [Thermodesulfobacteriota bacterium]|nr:class 1 fructose-bisphosphatase [Thermodesulfobacteriota bacterium]
MGKAGTTKFHVDFRRHLRDQGVERNLVMLMCELSEASKYIINSIRTGDLGVAGTSNLYGEEQLALDVLSDRILQKRLKNSGVVASMVSEENNDIIRFECEEGQCYSVAYDPLDGSSLVDVNLAVGTIISIYKGDNVLQKGRDQVAAMYILYGPRTTLVYTTGDGVHEFGMNQLMEYTLVQENIRIDGVGGIYSPGGQRNLYTSGTKKYVLSLEASGHKLRYSGGFVPDINQVLMKGRGIFMYPHLKGRPEGKLRLLYELNPMALLVEQAGGAASNGHMPILDIKPEGIDMCAPVFIGCREDVATAEKFIAEE